MRVLSLFDGFSGARIALERAWFDVEKYYASEIDKYAIKVAQENYPDTVQLGDVTKLADTLSVSPRKFGEIDLLVGGSPCKGFSYAGKQLNFDDPRSKLFFDYVRILNAVKPKYFLLENVRMKQEYQNVISDMLGVDPIMINSALVSAQNRKRLYWTDIPWVTQPADRGVVLDDVLFHFHNNYFKVDVNTLLLSEKAINYMNKKVSGGRDHWDFHHHSDVRDKKSQTVVANFFRGVPYNVLKDWWCIRKFHPIECERLQTVPDNYTNHVSNTQRYKMLGNGFTIDVIAHILKNIKETSK